LARKRAIGYGNWLSIRNLTRSARPYDQPDARRIPWLRKCPRAQEGIIVQNLFEGRAVREEVEDIGYADAESPNAWPASALSLFHRDSPESIGTHHSVSFEDSDYVLGIASASVMRLPLDVCGPALPCSNDIVITNCYADNRRNCMAVQQREAAKREALNLRIKPQVRELIDRAAALAGKNRTDFVLDAARRAAQDTLLDHVVFTVSPKAYRQFLARLDAPAKPNKRLLKSMQMRVPWE
jgi:uncharacterized protein (DUF1778 family)